MTRRGLHLCLLPTLIFLTFFGSNLLAQPGTSDPEWAPTITVPNDTTIVWCEADSICYEISGWDYDTSDSIWMSLISGPIEFTPFRFGHEFTTTVCFRPEGSGVYPFIWQFVDRQEHVVVDTVVYTVDLGAPPVLEDQQFSAVLCDLQSPRVLPLSYSAEGRSVSFELLSGPGTIDAQTGVIRYEPDTSGVFAFEVALTSDCGSDTATITDQLKLNLPPYCIGFDTTIYLCDVQKICVDVVARDPEGDPIQITMPEGLGTFVQLTDSTGQTCFTPRDIDTAEYVFIFRAADSCTLNKVIQSSEPYCCYDTVKVIVIITEPGELACPADTTVKLCVPPERLPSTICIPGFSSTWSLTSVSFGTLKKDTLCFEADTLGTYSIRFIGADTCGHADTCITKVKVVGNQVPIVSMADDYNITLCAPETICFQAGIVDPDFDVTDVSVNYGRFNQSAGTICFDVDTSGIYTIVMTATDDCGSSAVGTTKVTVVMHDVPTVSLGEDRKLDFCTRQEICIDAIVTGDEIEYYATSSGAYYNEETHQVCFTPDKSGRYEIFLQAFGACERVAADTVVIDVTVGSAPTITGFVDSTIYLCYPREICLPLSISDPDDDIASVRVSRGKYTNGAFCFVPYSMGDYVLVVTVTDKCGHVVVDTAKVSVKTDQGIKLVTPGDTTIFLCAPDTLCFPIGGVPEGAQVSIKGTSAWWNAETQSICFYSDCCLENKLTVSVKTECGTYSKSFTVDVQTNSRPLVVLPKDTTIFQCTPATICLPVGISDIDGNVETISVTNGRYDAYDRTICLDQLVEGVNTIGVTVTDSCGATATDQITVTLELNDAPWVNSMLEDTVVTLCKLEPIWVPFEYGDVNGHKVVVTTDGGVIGMIDFPGTGRTEGVYYTPSQYGDQCFHIFATDPCGLADTATVCITVVKPESVAITCPEAISNIQCGGGSFCVDIPITGEYSQVTTNYGTWVDGKWCIDLTEPINGFLEITAKGECDTAFCRVPLNLFPVESPQLTCPADLDTLMCGPGKLVFDVPLLSAFGPDELISATYPATVEMLDRIARVSVPVNEPGQQVITLTYENPPCKPYTCSFTINARFNTTPVASIEGEWDTSCELFRICIPFTYGDVDNNVVSITASEGDVTWAEGTGQFCFTPTIWGEYNLTLTVTDACGAEVMVPFTVRTVQLPNVALQCPETFAPITYCEPGEHCIDLPIDGTPISVTANYGTWTDGKLCFNLEQPGKYDIQVIAVGPCNTDTCFIPVVINTPANVSCGIADTSLLICSEDVPVLLQMPVTVGGDNVQVTVIPEMFTYADGVVRGEVSQAGIQTVMIIAYNDCSRDSCEFVITATMNLPPVVTVEPEFNVTQCGLKEICVPFAASDPEGDLRTIRASLGIITGNTVCFTPKAYGEYTINITVEDGCGASSSGTIKVTVTEGQYISLTCPTETIALNIGLPDTVRVPVGVTPSNATVTISPNGYYDAATGEAVVYIETEGLHLFTVTSTGDCNADTCGFALEIGNYIPPFVECVGAVDTLLCLAGSVNVCLPVDVHGTGVQVEVTPPAVFTGDAICLTVSEPGEYVIDILARTDRDTATCQTVLKVTGGRAPVLHMPEALSYTLCGSGEVCFDVAMEDAEFDITNIHVNYGSYDINKGQICFQADTAGVYAIEMTVADSCGNSTTGITQVTIGINEPPHVSLGEDQTILGCTLSQVCIDATIVSTDKVTITTNLGQYNSETGKVCFTPEGPGRYELTLDAIDECGRKASDTVVITVDTNDPPVIAAMRDTTIYLCYPREICLEAQVSDPDGNLASVTPSRGKYVDGRLCFVPYGMGDYRVILTAVDSCGATVKDTAVVTIKTDQNISIVCPGDTTVFLCEPDTLCFPIEGIPDGATVKIKGVAAWWNAETKSVCFYSDCCLENKLTVSATTACGTYSCSFTVSVQTNSRPLVLLPRDTTVLQCQSEKICLPVGISDVDGNITTVTATGATYDAYYRVVCFTPTGAGTYNISVTATDACGAVGTDKIVVVVGANQPPVISYTPIDTIYQQCKPETICLPIGISDPDGNLTGVSVTGGTYNAQNGTICILPTGIGTFCAQVTATDNCGLTAQREICVTVAAGDYVDIQCPQTPLSPIVLCAAQTVCVDLPITGTDFTVNAGVGTWSDNQLCFRADSSGTYMIRVVASSMCNVDTCTVSVPVTILPTLSVTAPANDTQFLCAADTLCYAFSYSPSAATVTVSAPAYLSGGQVCVPVLSAGTQNIKLTVSNQCGSVEGSFSVTTTFNSAPVVSAGVDKGYVECSLHEICLPISITDVNNNIVQRTTSLGSIVNDALLCFTPASYGLHQIIITAVDACGKSDADTVVVNYTEGAHAAIQCPGGTQYASVCGVDTVFILAPITPANATVTILPAGFYKPATGEIGIPVTKSGTIAVTIIAAAQCESDTCKFNLAVDMGIPPVVQCPGTIDTLMCLAAPDTLVVPITATGTGLQVNVNPSGFYSAGYVHLPITAAGRYVFSVIAFGSCGADTCQITVNATADKTPVFTVPETMTFERCSDDVDAICIDGIFASDVESHVTITKVCGPGSFVSTTGDSGTVCFTPPAFGQFEFCFQATDGCHTVEKSFLVNVVSKADCDVCVRLTIDGGAATPVGLRKRVAVNIESNDAVAGFDLLIGYDKTALIFQVATMSGGDAETWEYFTWNVLSTTCSGCPSGVIRFVGIADRNNGAAHPPDSAYYLNGKLFDIEYQVVNDQNLGDVFVPVSFVWMDCADNALSEKSGTVLYVDSRIYNAEGVIIWDESDDITYPESARVIGLGAPDECIVDGAKTQAVRCAEFHNGGVKIISPDEIDDRGDINLNEIAYEIADAVMFSNYFVHGLNAFSSHVDGSVAASDVNADGLTLTVADLALLIRVIIGDAQPIPKTTPYAEIAEVFTTQNEGAMHVGAKTLYGIGAAYFVYDIAPGVSVGKPVVLPGANGLTVISGIQDGRLHLLLYDIGTARVDAGRYDLIEVPVSGNGSLTLAHSEIVDYQSRGYVSTAARIVPEDYELLQNYPNPFNPSTTISFALPGTSDWALRIYNITGALVWEQSGHSGGGVIDVMWDGRSINGEPVASGVYLYRLDANDYSSTRKMILLK
jgi:hypothetical protein